jgi:nicotinic acid phosphoribosyltransferase
MSGPFGIPLPVLTDTYKISHPFQYPDSKKMVAYSELRCGYNKDKEDTRILFYGIGYILEHYVNKKWSMDDIEKSEQFFAGHNAAFSSFEWPKDLFLKIVKKHNGYFPVTIEALPDGSVIYPHTPVVVISAENEFSRLVTFLETILTMLWVKNHLFIDCSTLPPLQLYPDDQRI